jgi:mannose-6-phosphate isomerase-like protein (cupin superfamily)
MQVSGVEFAFGVGGEYKANSSSTLLNDWQFRKQDRVWGSFRDLFKDVNVRVKELVIVPGQGISYQRHFRRSEHWVVSQGQCTVKLALSGDSSNYELHDLTAGESIEIPTLAWHQVFNENTDPCHIIEVQYGAYSTEEDIERLEHYKSRT